MTLKNIDERIISDNVSILDQILLHGYQNYNHDTNKKILLSTIKFSIDVKDFLCKIKKVSLSKKFFFLCVSVI